jgi:hypothetical protein
VSGLLLRRFAGRAFDVLDDQPGWWAIAGRALGERDRHDLPDLALLEAPDVAASGRVLPQPAPTRTTETSRRETAALLFRQP